MSDEAIHLGDATDFIECRILERCASGTPSDGDIRLGVVVCIDNFCGKYEQVWIAAGEWRNFISSLQRLERDRSGSASIVSLSPGEFELHLQIVNRWGHLVVHGCLSRYHFGHPSGTATRSQIAYHFGVDASLLRQIADSFALLSHSSD